MATIGNKYSPSITWADNFLWLEVERCNGRKYSKHTRDHEEVLKRKVGRLWEQSQASNWKWTPQSHNCKEPCAATTWMSLEADSSCEIKFILYGKKTWNIKISLLFFGLPLALCALCICIMNLLQFSHSVVSDSLWPQALQHARPPCPSATSGACSHSCPLSWWCHPTISSLVIPFSCLQSFPASASFPVAGRKPILTPCWNCFFDLPFVAFVVIIIQNGLPQKILPLCLTVKHKCLYSEPCPRVDGRKEDINTSHAWGLPF